jgi:hypothetical protein
MKLARFLSITIAALNLLPIGNLAAQSVPANRTSITLPSFPQSKGGVMDLIYAPFDAAFLKTVWCRNYLGRTFQLAFISRDGISLYVGRRFQTSGDWNVTRYTIQQRWTNEFAIVNISTYRKTVCVTLPGKQAPENCGTFPYYRDRLIFRSTDTALMQYETTLSSSTPTGGEIDDETWDNATAKSPTEQWHTCNDATPPLPQAAASGGFSELRACIGERDGGCGRRGSVRDWGGVYDKRYACYTPYESIARDMGCVRRDSSSLRRYDVDTIKPKALGNQCGYEWVRVRCYDE